MIAIVCLNFRINLLVFRLVIWRSCGGFTHWSGLSVWSCDCGSYLLKKVDELGSSVLCSLKKLHKEWWSKHEGKWSGERMYWWLGGHHCRFGHQNVLGSAMLMAMDRFTLSCSMLGSISDFLLTAYSAFCLLCLIF